MVCDATCRFFDVEPTGRSLFSRVNVADMQSGEFNAFMLRVLTTLTELINKLHSPEVLDSMLEHLANQHAAMPGVKVKKRQQFSVMHLKEFTLANHLHLQSIFSP